jgi:acetyltransferase-like isoleucine patch superfamily enzyme/lysophospholipase L1-like esterase
MSYDLPGLQVGTDCEIDAEVVFEIDPGAKVLMGDRVTIRRGTTIQANRGSRIVVGDDVAIGENVFISAMVAIVIGSGVGVSNQVDIRDHNHVAREARLGDLGLQPWASGFAGAPIVIERAVLLSNKVTITAGSCVGHNAIVGANSVVTRHVRPNSVVGGSPARPIREFDGVAMGEVFRPPLRLGWCGTSIMEHPVAISATLEAPWPVPEIGDTVEVTSRSTGGYVRSVNDALRTEFPHLAITSENHAIGGATSRDLLPVCHEMAAHGPAYDIAFFGCGLNDVWRGFQGKTDAAVDLEEFARNVQESLGLLATTTRKLVYVEETPFGRELEELPTARMNHVLEQYMAAARGVAAAMGAEYVPVTRAFLRTAATLAPQDDLWADGVHLSRLGDQLLTHLVLEHLRSRGTVEGLCQLQSLDREVAPAHYGDLVDEAAEVALRSRPEG